MQWVLRAQCRDRDALELLLRSVQPALRRYVHGLVGPSDADDVLQDVLVIIIRKLWSLHDPQLFRPWAFRHIRKRRLWHGRHDDAAELDRIEAPEKAPSADLLRELLKTRSISPASR